MVEPRRHAVREQPRVAQGGELRRPGHVAVGVDARRLHPAVPGVAQVVVRRPRPHPQREELEQRAAADGEPHRRLLGEPVDRTGGDGEDDEHDEDDGELRARPRTAGCWATTRSTPSAASAADGDRPRRTRRRRAPAGSSCPPMCQHGGAPDGRRPVRRTSVRTSRGAPRLVTAYGRGMSLLTGALSGVAVQGPPARDLQPAAGSARHGARRGLARGGGARVLPHRAGQSPAPEPCRVAADPAATGLGLPGDAGAARRERDRLRAARARQAVQRLPAAARVAAGALRPARAGTALGRGPGRRDALRGGHRPAQRGPAVPVGVLLPERALRGRLGARRLGAAAPRGEGPGHRRGMARPHDAGRMQDDSDDATAPTTTAHAGTTHRRGR